MRTLLLAALALVLAGCARIDPLSPPPRSNGDADLTTYVAMGTSVSMGIQSGGLLDVYQETSIPALVRLQTMAPGATPFVQPLVASPGIPNLLRVKSLAPLTLGTLPGRPPAGTYVARPADGFSNLAISGALLANAIAKPGGNPYFDLVLQGHGPMLRQAIAQHPTFLTVELGTNDAIRPLLLGGDPSAILPVPAFAALYTQLMDSLAAGAPQAQLALANIPCVTSLPYATTVPIDVVVPGGITVRLRGTAGALPDGSLILLPALPLVQAGHGLPGATVLPDSLVITATERAAIESAIAGYNQAIAAEAQARGAALVDQFALLERLARDGYAVNGARFTFAFVTGGLFSLDGIHPSSVGSAILANAWIEAINVRFGGHIPPVDLGAFASRPVSLARAGGSR
jgi:lysophospholipase L1-like esterase